MAKLQNEGMVKIENGKIIIETSERLQLALKALKEGADVQNISSLLSWQEFEGIAKISMEMNGYKTYKNLRFKQSGRRWEIDAVGCKEPIVICIDCKHWNHGINYSSLNKMVSSQFDRVVALSDFTPNKSVDIPCFHWNRSIFIPVVLSLVNVNFKLVDGVPVVPVLALQNFICQLPLNLDSVKSYVKEYRHL
jgi:hypothetical protein